MLQIVAQSLASCLGLGLLPKAPGTFGSIAGLALVYWWQSLTGLITASAYEHFLALCDPVMLLVQLVALVLTLWSIKVAEKPWGHDASCIVIDELVGMFYTLALFPLTYFNLGVGFLLFRLFDIVKRGPVGYFDRRPESWATLVDDVLAGVLAASVLGLLGVFLVKT